MRRILLILIFLTHGSLLFCQNTFSVKWPLTNPATGGTGFTANVAGPVEALDEKFVGTEINQYTGPSNSQRVRMKTTPSNTWPANIKDKIDTVFVEFVVASKIGVQLNATKLSVSLAATAINTMKAAIYYSTDASFKNPINVPFTTNVAGNYLVRDALQNIVADINASVPDGGKLYVRIYPWVETSTGASSKYMAIQNVGISGTYTGNVIASIPTITTTPVTKISTTSAISGGNITSDGGAEITERGVCWNTSENPTIANSRTKEGTGVGMFISTVSSLTNSTKYFLRAYATNSAGTSYGEEVPFTTMSALTVPVVTTTDVSSILVTTAVSGGNVTDWGGTEVTSRGVCWNTTGNPTIDDKKTIDGSGTGTFASALTELTKSTKYYIRAYATNNSGTGYGTIKEFTTQEPAPDVLKIVAQNGTGDYKTVQAAFRDVPINYTGRWIIYVKKGTYYELDTLAANKINVILVGEDRDNTILVNDKYATSGFTNPSTRISANDFTAMNLTFQNTSHDIAQALAIETNGDRIAFYNCSIKGYQDTFYGNGIGRIYFKDSFVEGTVDFIYGKSIMVFDNCTIKEIREGGYITAASTDAAMKFGINFLDCTITNDPVGYNGTPITSFYLGRPWQAQPRVAWIRCYEPATVNPLGWTTMAVTPALYAEYKCTGPGFKPSERTKLWSTVRQLTDVEAADYTVQNIFSKNSKSPAFATDWIPVKPSVTLPTGIEKEESKIIPDEYELMQNYPNPFNPETTIIYNLQAASQVSLKVYDVLGREIATLVDEYKQAGNYKITFNARHLERSREMPSGVFFYRLQCGNYSDTKKLILLK